MKCFIHFDKEAIAACRQCGKGMCAECSAYSGHTGVCPECRKKDFEKELATLREESKELKWGIVGQAVLCLTVILIPFAAVKIIIKARNLAKKNQRADVLTQEIEKLNKALNKGGYAFQ